MRVFSEPRRRSVTLPNRSDPMAGVPDACLLQRFSASTPGSQVLRLVATEFPPYTDAGLEGDGLERVGFAMTVQFRPWARAPTPASPWAT